MSEPRALSTDERLALPWRYEPERDNIARNPERMAQASSAGSIMDAENMHIARVWLCGPRPRMDGSLLAAAPDLLVALRAVLSVADRDTVEFDLARAAIAKAEGRS